MNFLENIVVVESLKSNTWDIYLIIVIKYEFDLLYLFHINCAKKELTPMTT
jgi:hypothetical protein